MCGRAEQLDNSFVTITEHKPIFLNLWAINPERDSYLVDICFILGQPLVFNCYYG